MKKRKNENKYLFKTFSYWRKVINIFFIFLTLKNIFCKKRIKISNWSTKKKKKSSVFFCGSCLLPHPTPELEGAVDCFLEPYPSNIHAVLHKHCNFPKPKHPHLIPKLPVHWSKQNDSQHGVTLRWRVIGSDDAPLQCCPIISPSKDNIVPLFRGPPLCFPYIQWKEDPCPPLPTLPIPLHQG